MPDDSPSPLPEAKSTVKETFISVIIAFALAFVFRGFVVEAFLIPTGSMAPTLMGAHMRFTDPKNGYSWPVGPWDMVANTGDPQPYQGSRNRPVRTMDPLTLESVGDKIQVRTRAGDRIFVMKYLYSIYDPARFDVVVFKNPNNPAENYIKRLIGLPGEHLALVDGDVFVRTPLDGESIDLDAMMRRGENPWLLPGWRIARKPELAQRSMWQLVFDSRYTPITSGSDRPFQGPWLADGKPGDAKDWQIAGHREYRYAGAAPTSLVWDARRPVRDYYAYNETPLGGKNNNRFPVSDLRLSMGVRPDADALSWSAIVAARGHEFRARVSPAAAGKSEIVLDMRAAPEGGMDDAPWITLAKKDAPLVLRKGEVANLDFWHVDQSLQLWINDELAVEAPYEWSIQERLSHALTLGATWRTEAMNRYDLLTSANLYKAPAMRFEFAGGAFTLFRVALSRDIFYQPDMHPPRDNQPYPARSTSPRAPLVLNHQQFFTCGDNSPNSLDARLWDAPDPWVAQMDPTPGVVNRDLLIGKAFFVYFPAPEWIKGVPIPDVGRMRFIW